MLLNAVMYYYLSGNFLHSKNKKDNLFPFFKTDAQSFHEPRHQTAAT